MVNEYGNVQLSVELTQYLSSLASIFVVVLLFFTFCFGVYGLVKLLPLLIPQLPFAETALT